MALTKKQRDFITSYLDCWNATKAAIDAGYPPRSARSVGSENLTKPDIKAAIEAHIAQIMPKGKLLTRWAEHADATADDFLTIERVKRRDTLAVEVTDDEGKKSIAFVPGPEYEVVETRPDLEKAKRNGKLHLLKEYKVDKDGAITVKWHDAQTALREWVKIHGLGKDDGGILKYIDLGKLNQDQLQRIRDGEDILAVLLDKPETASGGGAGAAEARTE